MPGEEVVSPADAEMIICHSIGNDGVNDDKNEFGPRRFGPWVVY
jgi:hypothetical protein